MYRKPVSLFKVCKWDDDFPPYRRVPVGTYVNGWGIGTVVTVTLDARGYEAGRNYCSAACGHGGELSSI